MAAVSTAHHIAATTPGTTAQHVAVTTVQHVAATTPTPPATIPQAARTIVQVKSGGVGFWNVLLAVGGGIAGAAAAVLVRSLDVPTEIKRMDAAIKEQDDAFADWLADLGNHLQDEIRELHRRGDSANAQRHRHECMDPKDSYGDAAKASAEAKHVDELIVALRAGALSGYRDKEREVRLAVANIVAAEQWQHRAWRKWKKIPRATLTTLEKAKPLLESWRKTSNHGGMPLAVDDATTRTLTTVLQREYPNGLPT